MVYILLSLILFLVLMILFLITRNSKIKQEHLENMNRLEAIIASLNLKQQQLNEKVMISAEYKSNYSKDMKSLGDEVVKLQKVFIDIISNQNSN